MNNLFNIIIIIIIIYFSMLYSIKLKKKKKKFIYKIFNFFLNFLKKKFLFIKNKLQNY